MRRFPGRVGWPVVFLLVAGLVFAGLGWVTHAALGVERAQREAAARAEQGNNLRVALWRLDGRMLPALGVEDSRPFYHYDSPDPAGAYGPAATPLLVAALPDWMKLHFRLDPASGWESNQAPADPAEAARVRQAWPDLPLRNWYGGREVVLAELREKLPAPATCDLFAARDRAILPDSLPLAAQLFTEVNAEPAEPNDPTPEPPAPGPKPPPPFDPGPRGAGAADPTSGNLRVLGFELCPAEADPHAANQQVLVPPLQDGNARDQKKAGEGGKLNPATPQLPEAGNPSGRGPSRVGPKSGGDEQPWAEYFNRAQTSGKGRQEARGAGGYDYPVGNNIYQNTMPPGPAPVDNKSRYNPVPGGSPVVTPAPPIPAGLPAPVPPAAPLTQPNPADKGSVEKEKAVKELAELFALLGIDRDGRGVPRPAGDALNSLRAARDAFKADAEAAKRLEAKDGPDSWSAMLREVARLYEERKAGAVRVPNGPPAAAPGEDRPPQPPAPAPNPPVVVHVGLMRPQWVGVPGGPDLLVLVRAAKFETKTVYQGVVLDWEKLRAALQDEVKDLFPDARLVPVTDPAGVSPDRAMTALPVQLDPGPDPTPPPAGWTPLRIGLVTAWAAAALAVLAVGFSGWTLVDHAERRMRFVSAVTHELRTPLTSLRLYLDLLLSGMIRDDAKRQEYLSTLAAESDRLHRLIDNVLDFAKLEKRRAGGDVKVVGVADLLEPLRATWADRVAQDGKELVAVSTLPPGREVRTDPAMVVQIVGNLIDNARKYTRDAADPRIWLRAGPGAGTGVVLEVEDRGPGVPASERRSIFKPFRRGAQADTRAGGAGLGLALAKSWAEVLGARLTYRPADGGVGACFRLELPGC